MNDIYSGQKAEELRRIADALERIGDIMAVRARSELAQNPLVSKMHGSDDDAELSAVLSPRPRR